MLKIVEKPDLPKEIFKGEVQPQLIAQAVRVYLANQRQGTQSALTRAEVNRTRKKVFKQKGTGHARHGDRKAPIFVGGGIAFAPKPRDYSLNLSGPMKLKAQIGALTSANAEKKISVVSGLGKLSGKTKELAKFLGEQSLNYLIITDQNRENIWRAGRNLENVEVVPVNQLNTYQIVRAKKLLIMEEALPLFRPSTPLRASEIKRRKPETESKKTVVKTVKK